MPAKSSHFFIELEKGRRRFRELQRRRLLGHGAEVTPQHSRSQASGAKAPASDAATVPQSIIRLWNKDTRRLFSPLEGGRHRLRNIGTMERVLRKLLWDCRHNDGGVKLKQLMREFLGAYSYELVQSQLIAAQLELGGSNDEQRTELSTA